MLVLILLLWQEFICPHFHLLKDGFHSRFHSELEKCFHFAPMTFSHSLPERSSHFPPYFPLAYYTFRDFPLENLTDCHWITMTLTFSFCFLPYIFKSLHEITHVVLFASPTLISCIRLSLFSTLTVLLSPMPMRISFRHQTLVCHRCTLRWGF